MRACAVVFQKDDGELVTYAIRGEQIIDAQIETKREKYPDPIGLAWFPSFPRTTCVFRIECTGYLMAQGVPTPETFAAKGIER